VPTAQKNANSFNFSLTFKEERTKRERKRDSNGGKRAKKQRSILFCVVVDRLTDQESAFIVLGS